MNIINFFLHTWYLDLDRPATTHLQRYSQAADVLQYIGL